MSNQYPGNIDAYLGQIGTGGGGSSDLLNYRGTYNATTNTPTLVNGTGTKGDWYYVIVGGSNSPTGVNINAGDAIAYNGAIWEDIPNAFGNSDDVVVSDNYIVISGHVVAIGQSLTYALGALQGQINAIPESTTNVLSSAVNTMTSDVNGHSSTAPIVNSNSISYDGNNLTSTINGVASTPFEIDGSSIKTVNPTLANNTDSTILDTVLSDLYLPATPSRLGVVSPDAVTIVEGWSNPTVVGSPVSTGSEPAGIVYYLRPDDGTTPCLSIVNKLSNNITSYALISNVWTLFDTVSVGSSPVGIAFSEEGGPSGAYLVSVNSSADTCTILSFVGGHWVFQQTLTTGTTPTSAIIDNNSNLWVTNRGGNTIQGFNSGASFGAIATIAVGTSPQSLCFFQETDGDGYIVTTNTVDNTLTLLITDGMGSYTVLGSPIACVTSPVAIVSSPVYTPGLNGNSNIVNYVVVVGVSNSDIGTYQLNGSTLINTLTDNTTGASSYSGITAATVGGNNLIYATSNSNVVYLLEFSPISIGFSNTNIELSSGSADRAITSYVTGGIAYGAVIDYTAETFFTFEVPLDGILSTNQSQTVFSNSISYNGNDLISYVNGLASMGIEVDGGTLLGFDPTNNISTNTVTLNTITANLNNATQNIANGTIWYTCQAQATTNITISNPGTSTFDTVTLTVGQYLFLATGTQTSNSGADVGAYVFNGSSVPLTRVPALNTWLEITRSNIGIAGSGGVHSDARYYNANNAGGTIGVTPIIYNVWNTAYTGSSTIGLTGNAFNVINVPNNLTTATSANTASAIVARDSSGNFIANVITASLAGNANTSSACTGNSATATSLVAGVANQVVYQSGTGVSAYTTVNSTATNEYLRQVSSGVPTFTQIAYTDLSGLPTLGTAAALNTGTAINNVVQYSGSNVITATTFNGNATSSTAVATTQVSNNATYYHLLVSSSTNSNQSTDLVTTYTYNPSTGNLVVPNGGSTGSAANGVTYNSVNMSWIASTLPASSANWTTTAYGNGVWVAIQFGSTVAAYSLDDGKTWIQSAMPSAAKWISVTYGSGKFVAIAYQANNAAVSIDGINWTATTSSSSSNWYWVTYGLVAGIGYFVAVSQTSGTVAQYSINGINWTASTLPTTDNWQSVGYGVIGGTPYFVAVGASGTNTAYSANGTTWTAGGALPSSMVATSVAFGLIGGTPYFVVGGNNGANSVAYSINGTTWTQGTVAARCDYITYGNGIFVGVNANGSTSYYSTNGIAFTAGTTTVTAKSGPVVFGGNVFIVLPFTSSATAMYGFYTSAPQVTNHVGNNNIVTFDDLYNNILLPSSVLNIGSEGTWPLSDGSGASLTLTVVFSTYVKIGRQVTLFFKVIYPSNSDVTQAQIAGLPYPADTSSMVSFILNNSNNTTAANAVLFTAGSSTMKLYSLLLNSSSNINNSTANLFGTVTYTTAS